MNTESLMKRLMTLGPAALILAFALAIPVAAQTITATVTGEVTDQAGAVVQGATVTVTSVETGLSKTVQTNDSGRYTIAFLQPASYNIKFEKTGFAPATRENIKLETGQTAGINIALAVTAGEVSVDVESGEVPLLQTETSALDTTIENKLVEDLPSGERSALAFINLVPGAIDAGFAQGRGEGLNENGNAQGPIGSPGNRNFFDSNFSVNGGRSSTNDVLLDGVSNTVGDFNGVAVSPPQDSIREFKVVAGSYPAEYGRSGGGVVSISTKSGGKRYSGAVYEYFQDGDLNANGWQRNRRGVRANGQEVLPRIDIVRHQYGGAFGGPVTFFNFGDGPDTGFFKKQDKTFFFFNYEGRFEKNPFSKEITLPTARMRTGDLSEVASTVYDPYITGRNTAFAGNNLSTLPVCTAAPGQRTAACLDPVARAVLQFIPLPNQPGTSLNYIFDGKATFRRDIYAFRLDHTLSENHSFFTRFSYEKRFTSEPNYLEGSVAANVRKVRDTFLNFTFNDVYSFTPSLINNFRYGYTRVRANQIPESFGFDPTTLGLPADFRERAAALKFPDFTIGGANSPGEITSGQIGGAGNDQPRDTHTVANAMTLIRGKQTWRFGGEYRLLRFFPFQFFTPTGSFTFNRTWTANAAGVGGSPLASFLLGLPGGGNQETVVPLTIYHHYGAAFAQNDWRINSRLVLNLGLRWDFETGTGEANGAMTNFDLLAPSPVQGQQQNLATLDRFVAALNPNVANNKGLLSFVDGPQTDTNYDRFAPRVGFAFKINDKTTVRGGYGLFFVPTSIENPAAQGTNFTSQISQVANQTTTLASATGVVYLTNPFPAGIPRPPGTTLGARTRLAQQVFAVEPERDNPYNQQWNLVFQRELTKNTVLDIAYVGSRAVNLPIQSVELNEISAGVLEFARNNFNQPNSCGAAACADVPAFFTQQVTNPFAGLFSNVPGFSTAVNNPTVQRLQLLRAYPQYTSVQLFRPHWGYSSYNALQINLQRRFTNGLSGTVNYTWSKLLDTGGVGNGAAFLDSTAIQDASNFGREYSLSTLDVPHRFVASWSYELPFGQKKKFGSNWNGLANFFLGGWQTAGSYTWQTGAPIPITVTNAWPGSVGISAGVRRPDRLAGENFSTSDARNNVVAQGLWFNPALFTDPVFPTPTARNNFVFGNAARTYADIRRDNYRTLNLSILKNWYWADGKQKLQFRAEFLNAFNWVVYGTPVSNLNVTGAVGTANNNTLNSANPCFALQQCFGQVRTQGNTPRNIQMVLRYTF